MRPEHVLWLVGMSLVGGWPLSAGAQSPDSESARRERVATMSDEEKAELRRKQESFVKLSSEEQARIRALHAALQASDDAARLRGVLERYHAWLGTLSSGEKAELTSLPAAERVARIKLLMQKQEDERFRKEVSDKLTREDREAIMKWLLEFAIAHKAAIIEAAPRERRPRDPERWPLMFAMLSGWADGNANMPRPQTDDVQQLIEQLSPAAQETFQSVREPQQRMEVAQKWIRAAVASRRWSAPPPVSKEELRKFYAEKLSASERERLEALSREELQQALQRLYYEHHARGRGGPPWMNRGGPRHERDGDDRRTEGRGPPPAPPVDD